jgi:uncharacterized protein (UPF0548 family)
MFLTHRPNASELENFVDHSRELPLSYHPTGIAQTGYGGFRLDTASAVIGKGRAAFVRAQQALAEWRQIDFGWVQLFPPHASLEPGTVVAVLVEHLGFWSLNGCRIVYSVGDKQSSFGFAYGTLTNHAEMGEEIFEVSMTESDEVTYRISAASRPRAVLARIGYPYTRFCQARFRRDSIAAMKRAIENH